MSLDDVSGSKDSMGLFSMFRLHFWWGLNVYVFNSPSESRKCWTSIFVPLQEIFGNELHFGSIVLSYNDRKIVVDLNKIPTWDKKIVGSFV